VPFGDNLIETVVTQQHLENTISYLFVIMGLVSQFLGLKQREHKQGPHKPPFAHVPGYLWQTKPDEGKAWHLVPDTTTYSGDRAKHMGIKDASKIPEGWKPSDGLIPGWKLPKGIARYFSGGVVPEMKKSRRHNIWKRHSRG
jgi:hypothetical protein